MASFLSFQMFVCLFISFLFRKFTFLQLSGENKRYSIGKLSSTTISCFHEGFFFNLFRFIFHKQFSLIGYYKIFQKIDSARLFSSLFLFFFFCTQKLTLFFRYLSLVPKFTFGLVELKLLDEHGVRIKNVEDLPTSGYEYLLLAKGLQRIDCLNHDGGK